MTEVFAKELYDYYLTFNINNPKINLDLFNLFTDKLNILNEQDLINSPISNISVKYLGNEFNNCIKDIKFVLKQDKYKKMTFNCSLAKDLHILNNDQNILFEYFCKLPNTLGKFNGMRKFIIDNDIQNLDFFNNREKIQDLIINITNDSHRSAILNIINVYYTKNKIKNIVNKRYFDAKNRKIPKYATEFIIKYENFNKIINILTNYAKLKQLSKTTCRKNLSNIYVFNKMIFEKDIIFHDISLDSLIEFYKIRISQVCYGSSKELLYLINLLIDAKFFININKKFSILDISTSNTILESEIENPILDIDDTKRDYFTDIELNKIKEESKKNITDELIITLLSHYGLRIGGLINIHINNIYNFETNELLETGKTLEKGNKIRYFNITLDFELSKCLTAYLKENPHIIKNKYYLFHSVYTYSNISNQAMRSKINTICNNAGVIGSHVHPHAFRKTVVINLMKLGNSIDTVSKFIGHSSPNTTRNSYWVETNSDLTDNMIIPWIRTSKNVITLKDIGKLTKDVNIEVVSEKSGVSKDFLYFIQDVYQPLKKKCNILEEKLSLALSLLSSESNKKYLNEEQNIIEKINKKYEDYEKNKSKSEISNELLSSIAEVDDTD